MPTYQLLGLAPAEPSAPPDPYVAAYINALDQLEFKKPDNSIVTMAGPEDAYLKLLGRAGGQVAYGGTVAGDDLTLESTSDATKGDILLQPNGGYVGVGPAAPNQALTVSRTAAVGGIDLQVYSTNWSHAPYVQFRKSGQNTVGLTTTDDEEVLGGLAWYGNDGSAWKYAASLYVEQDGTTGGTYIPAFMSFYVTNAAGSLGVERLRLADTVQIQPDSGDTIFGPGNVGIGTTPASALHVLGSQFRWDSSATSTDPGILFTAHSTYAQIRAGQVGDYSTNIPLVFQANGGNVGIGVTSPGSALQVAGSIAATGYSSGMTGVKGVVARYNASDWGEIVVYDWPGGTYKNLRIDASALLLNAVTGGNVGIGTTPATLLHLLDATPVLRLQSSNARAAGSEYIEFGGTESSAWSRTGFIGDGSGSLQTLDFWGDSGTQLRFGANGSQAASMDGSEIRFARNVYLDTRTLYFGTTGTFISSDVNGSLYFVGPDSTDAQYVSIGGNYMGVWNQYGLSINTSSTGTASGNALTLEGNLWVRGEEGLDGTIYLYADQGDDNPDKWKLVAGAGGTQGFALYSYATGSWVNRFFVSNAGVIYTLPTYNNSGGTSANVYIDSSGILYRVPSSEKYKTDIADLPEQYGWDLLSQFRPITYRLKTALDAPVQVGLMAEQLDQLLSPNPYVDYDSDGQPEGINYDRMIVPMIATIQRLSDRIAALETKLN